MSTVWFKVSEMLLACTLLGELANYVRNCVHAENPFASDEAVAGVYVYLHFKQFLKLYNSPAHDRAALDSACGHVQVCLPELKTSP